MDKVLADVRFSGETRGLARRWLLIADEISALNGVYESRQARWQQTARLVEVLENFLSASGREFVEARPIEPPKIPKGGTVADAVEARRRRIRELRADRHQVVSAPIPSARAKQIARQQVEQLARGAVPDCSDLIERGDPIRFPETYPTNARNIPYPDGHFEPTGALIPNALGLVAWLHRDALVAALDKEIDAVSDDKAAMSDEARAARLNEIAADELAVEREEEMLILMSEEAGAPVARRPDASPVAVLGVAA